MLKGLPHFLKSVLIIVFLLSLVITQFSNALINEDAEVD